MALMHRTIVVEQSAFDTPLAFEAARMQALAEFHLLLLRREAGDPDARKDIADFGWYASPDDKAPVEYCLTLRQTTWRVRAGDDEKRLEYTFDVAPAHVYQR